MKKLYTMLFLLLVSSLTLFAQTETEPNDNINQGSNSGNTFTASTTTTLSIGATLTVANNDFYKINLPSCGSWAFTLINDSGQGVVNVKFYNVQNITTPIGNFNYNFDNGLPGSVIFNCGQTIWVQVDQISGTDIGAYKLEVSQYTTGDTYECNNSYETATTLSNINSSFSAKLWGYDCNGNPDADYFTYTPTKCGVLKVVVTGQYLVPGQNIGAELEVKVYDAITNQLIVSLGSSSYNIDGLKGALLEANKKYYIVITDRNTGGGDVYDLFDDPFTVTTTFDTSDIYECNNTYSTAATLPIGQSFDIKLWGENSQINLEENRPQDADYFTYTPTQCGVLKVVVTGQYLVPGQNIGAELEVKVYDAISKQLIVSLGSSSFNIDGLTGALLEANKKYYIVITDRNTGGGDVYDLFDDLFTVTTSYDTSDIYECNNTYSTAATLPIGQSFDIKLWGQNSQINLEDIRSEDADYFTYTPTQCGVLKVVVTGQYLVPGQNIGAELEVKVYDAISKQLIVSLGSSSFNIDGLTGALLEANKKYYIVITDRNTGGGDVYDLFDDPFTVTTSYDTSDIYECNNRFEEAKPITSLPANFQPKLWGVNNFISDNSIISGTDSSFDQDWYSVTTTICGILNFSIAGVASNQQLVIQVYNESKAKISEIIGGYGASVSLTNLLSASTYYIRIYDQNTSMVDDPISIAVTFLTSPVVTQVGTTYSTIQTSSSQSNTYQWYRNGALISGANSSSYTSSLAGPYTVCISNPSSCSTCSANLSNESFEQSVLSVYPNPTSSILKLQFDNNTAIDKVIITDMSGKKVLEQTQNNSQINVESLAKGTYVIEVSSENKKFQSKFIKE